MNERRESDAAHQPVEQKRGARQVAAVFEQQDEQEQDQDLRQEYQHAAGALDHAIDQQALQRTRGHAGAHCGAERGHAGIDQVHRHRGPTEHRLEHGEQQHRQQDRARDRVHHHGIETRERARAQRLDVAGKLQDAARLALGGGDLGRGIGGHRRLPGLKLSGRGQLHQVIVGGTPRAVALGLLRPAHDIECRDQIALTRARNRNSLHDRQAQFRFEPCAIELEATAVRQVAHVQRNDHRLGQATQLEHQAQRQLQIGGIDHADDQLGGGFIAQLAVDDIARDGLIECRRHQAVGARQVDELILPAAISAVELTFLALDGNARVVRDLLPTASQPVEQCSFAAIGYPDQRDPAAFHRFWFAAHNVPPASTGGPTARFTITARASRRRSAKTLVPTRTASGSPPGQTSSMTWTISPGTKPISMSLRPIVAPSASPTMPASVSRISATTPRSPLCRLASGTLAGTVERRELSIGGPGC